MHSAKKMKRPVRLFLIFVCLVGWGARPAGAQEPPPPPPDPRFGIVEAFWTPEEAAELNLGWERILFYWREIQPTGPDDWNTLHVHEEWLREAAGRGRFVVGLLKNTPGWATDGNGEAGLPRGLYLPLDDPDNLWANYVRRVARYYGPLGVHNWVIWNEPDIAAGVYGFEFDGDVDDYVRMLKVSYLVIKEVDPEARIHLAGLTYWHDRSYLERLLEALVEEPDAAENDYYFDAVTLHVYFRSETVKTIVSETQQTLDKYELDKEIWINETNAAPSQDPEWYVERPQFPLDLEQQAWFIVQAYALGFAAGADSIGVYKMLDIHLPPGGESFGILRPDHSRRPAFEAYKTTIDYLRDFTEVSHWQEVTHYVVKFERPQGTTYVVWARTPNRVTIRIPAEAEQGFLVDALGESVTPIEPNEEGEYVVVAPGARCEEIEKPEAAASATPEPEPDREQEAGEKEFECLVGGPPLFLLDGAPEPLPTATPTISPTPTATRTPRPTATATHTPLPPTATATPTPTVTVSPTARAPAGADASPTPTFRPQAVTQNPPGRFGLLFILLGGTLLGGLSFVMWRARR